MRNLCFAICCLLGLAFTSKKESFNERQLTPVEKISLKGFNNLYKINDSLYRSEQPTKQGMKAVESIGIKTVLNFRNHHNDVDEAKSTSLAIERLSQNTNKLSKEFIITALKIIQSSKKPILVHCLHGSDRTGAVIAAYRLVFDNWTKEEAIKELKQPEFGYHETWFPNIVVLINELDVAYMKKELRINL